MAKLAPPPPRRVPKAALFFAGVAALAGTGGVMHAPASIGYGLPQLVLQKSSQPGKVAVRIRQIISELSISHAALARVMGVSRQAVYNWINGSLPNERHESLIADLYVVNTMLAPTAEPVRALLTKPIRDGKSFWQLVESGAEPLPLVEQLLVTHRQRESQRVLAQQRLAAKRARGAVGSGLIDDLI